MKKIIVIVLDGVGCGALPDAASYGDAGANTLGHVLAAHAVRLPVLSTLGLTRIPGCRLVESLQEGPPFGCYGRARERSPGKDTTTGHWELAGCPIKKAFPVFPEGFPEPFMRALEAALGVPLLGNVAASGTAIIQRLGEEHVRTRRPIVYTSADSVFQIAAHEAIYPPEKLYAMCKKARGLLRDDLAVARVIARPFTGVPGQFTRTVRRRDFSLAPPSSTMLDEFVKHGYASVGVGKIDDIFAGRGLTRSRHVAGNTACHTATLELIAEEDLTGLILVNLVDFDMLYGHRRDPEGFARALGETDTFIGRVMRTMGPDDLLIITADHGCDPTHAGTDHTREWVPLLAFGRGCIAGALGDVDMVDVSATALAWMGIPPLSGRPFVHERRSPQDA